MVRAAPASPRPRRRDGSGRRLADRHPAPTRAHQLGITSIYTQGIDITEIIDTVDAADPRWSPSTRRSECDRVALPVVVRSGSPEGYDVEARRL
jgi:hypothetical protein